MIQRSRSERGSALITAIALLGAMMALGVAALAFVDGQQSSAANERKRESAFNLAEAALNTQTFQLARSWPGTSALAYPAQCDPSSAPSSGCPTAGSIAASYTTPDYGSSTCPSGTPSVPWTTSVHDNGGGSQQFYNATIVNAQPTWDANSDGAVWVRAQSVAHCQVRTLVTIVALGTSPIAFPRGAISANWVATTNQGNKVLIDTLGSYAQPASVQQSNAQPGDVNVRCTAPVPSPCVNVRPGQIAPNTAKTVTQGGSTLSSSQLDGLKARASSLGTYFPAGTCPGALTGAMVYVEDFTGCNVSGNANSPSAPGFLYVARGSLSLGGNTRFYGLVYMGNLQASSGAVVSLSGTAEIQGAVVIDGLGGVSAGSSHANIVFDSRVFDLAKTAGNATVQLNTWRELPAGQ